MSKPKQTSGALIVSAAMIGCLMTILAVYTLLLSACNTVNSNPPSVEDEGEQKGALIPISVVIPTLAGKASDGSDSLASSSTGFIYPLNAVYVSDSNFKYCGADYFKNKRHIGSDLSAEVGTPVYAVAKGTVYSISPNGWGTGNIAVVAVHKAASGISFFAIYGHLKLNSLLVKVGSTLVAGQKLGFIGDWPDGAHLHFGIRPTTTLTAPFGFVMDNDCVAPSAVNSFVAPIAFLNENSPAK